ncbi:hypothetical protein C8Q73DRAFT_836471 [Cubamyces lactineus]|nr:hypothetical protein C8Q73DRAFT_836471 [Cubamyces lactineus]
MNHWQDITQRPTVSTPSPVPEPLQKQRLLFVTGTRADWGKLAPLAHAAASAGYTTDFFVTGMHMLDSYGRTGDEIFKHAAGDSTMDSKIHTHDNHLTGTHPTSVLASTLRALHAQVRTRPPDLLVVHGDRVEAFAACTVAAQAGLRCAHVEGGERSGSIDEQYRHCCTKLSTYHFVSGEAARRRVLALGEDPGTVFAIGSPELDAHVGGEDGGGGGLTLGEVKRRHGIPFAEYGIVTFHSVTSETDTIGAQAAHLFASLAASGRSFVVIAPNNDPGSDHIRAVLARLDLDLDLDPDPDPNLNSGARGRFHRVASVPFADFSVLLKGSSAVVGNSSAGIRETPFLGVPSLNVGTRQRGRAQADAESVTHVSAFDDRSIRRFLSDGMWGRRFEPHWGFGRGTAAREFVEVLDGSEGFWERDLQKSFCDDA